MSFQAFLNEIKKGLPSPVYLFHASDLFLQKEALDAIKGLIPENERDFNLHIFDLSFPGEDNPPFEQILNVANTVSFFGGRRFTIYIGNIQKLLKKDIEKLDAYIADPAPNSVFIIFHNGVLKKDARERFKALIPLSLDIRDSDIPHWIKQKFRMKGLEISDSAVDYLIGFVGTDLGLLSSEIEKISLLGKKRIELNDISDIVAGGRTYGIFDLVNALKERNAQKVFSIYKILRETTDDYSLIGALNWQYARELHPHGSPAENEYYSKAFELLNSADIDIKSSGRNFPMEFLLVKLLRLKASPPVKKGHSPSL